MYQIKGTGISFRLNNEETQQLNHAATQLQQDGNNQITSAKIFVLTLADQNALLLQQNEALQKEQQDLKTENADYLAQINALQDELKHLQIKLQQTEQTLLETLKTSREAVEEPDPTIETTATEEPEAGIQEPQHAEVSEKYERLIELIGYEEEPTELQLINDLISILSQPAEEPQVVEKIVEIERELAKGEVIVHLEEAQEKILETIARWRFHTKKDPQRLSHAQLIKKMVFNKGAIFNWHDQFATGLSEKHLRK